MAFKKINAKQAAFIAEMSYKLFGEVDKYIAVYTAVEAGMVVSALYAYDYAHKTQNERQMACAIDSLHKASRRLARRMLKTA